MVEVKIESIRVSLMSQYRVVILKDLSSNRYLPIWIGPYEADAITIHLQEVQVPRPLTHDLIVKIIEELDAQVKHVYVNDLNNDTFYARIVLRVRDRELSIDSRPSDAVAIAVRVECPIYVAEEVMDRAGVVPEEEGSVPDEDLGAFKDFIGSLDLDDLDKNQ
ncbi:MAG: bifunctional nuclease family protein [Anaerolineae bacterium]|nr:bifunctional nuclease family protein [Thermoflexales bacterium]MDW8407392.1 bifunctional nuclease family protein [Anaerolineae bacterium]